MIKLYSKHAQVSAFVIIAIVIVAVAALAITYFTTGTSSEDKIKSDIGPAYNEITNCIEKTGQDGIVFISQRGGYNKNLPNPSTDLDIPYYYSEGINNMPSRETIQNELANYINENLGACFDNIKIENIKITKEKILSKTNIEEQKVTIDLTAPITITKDTKSITLKDIKGISIPVRLGIIYDSIYFIIQEQMTHKDICISCIQAIAEQKDLYINSLNYDTNTFIFTVTDKNTKINGNDLIFNFANKYQGTKLD